MNIIGGETMFNAQLTRIGVALQSKLTAIKADDKGATAVEYGLIVGLIAVVIVAAVTLLGTKLDGLFDTINGKL
jgi:pilus assembly protein Flp/PilA